MATKAQRAEKAQWARELLGDLISEAMLERPVPAKPTELARALRERIAVSPRLVKEVLEQDARFLAADRRWTLATRAALNDRPFVGAAAAALEGYGKPMSITTLAAEVGAARKRVPEEIADLLATVLERESEFFEVSDGTYALSSWVLDVTDRDAEAIAFYAGLPEHELSACRAAIGRRKVRRDHPLETAVTILSAVERPVPNLLLAFLVWERHDRMERTDRLLADLLADERICLLSGPRWCTQTVHEGLLAAIRSESGKVDRAAGGAPEEVDLPAVLAAPAPRSRFTVGSDDVDEAVRLIQERGLAPLDELVEDVFELYAGEKGFTAAIHALARRLEAVERVMPVGWGRYCPRERIPAVVGHVPPVLVPVYISRPDEDGDETDALLTDTGLGTKLATAVHDPWAEDVGEEDEVKTSDAGRLPSEIACAIPYHHLQAGTFKIRQLERHLLPEEPRRLLLHCSYADEEHEVWVDNGHGLASGLREWYSRYVAAPGSIVHLVPEEEPGRLRFEFTGETDPDQYTEEARLAELLALRERALRDELPAFDLMREVMAAHPDGLSFRLLCAEVNVARRTAKRVIASNLASYLCFRPAKRGLWTYDEEQSEASRDRSKKRYFKRSGLPE